MLKVQVNGSLLKDRERGRGGWGEGKPEYPEENVRSIRSTRSARGAETQGCLGFCQLGNANKQQQNRSSTKPVFKFKQKPFIQIRKQKLLSFQHGHTTVPKRRRRRRRRRRPSKRSGFEFEILIQSGKIQTIIKNFIIMIRLMGRVFVPIFFLSFFSSELRSKRRKAGSLKPADATKNAQTSTLLFTQFTM